LVKSISRNIAGDAIIIRAQELPKANRVNKPGRMYETIFNGLDIDVGVAPQQPN
jgi:hypothetical protein